MKRAEELQRLLVNELNHRVKNTLATVQSISVQTLRGAADLRSARMALDDRIISLSRAHDLLTDASWEGADLADVVARAMQPFDAARLRLSGPALTVAPRHALTLSLALHELATNASKYGALSVAGGGVDLSWRAEDGVLTLSWRERGGPAVAQPTRRGFGSRLLEEGIDRELGGRTRVTYAPDGVRCEISTPL
jgi:two-component sensor histidine kinase